jgi:hypothetical protein
MASKTEWGGSVTDITQGAGIFERVAMRKRDVFAARIVRLTDRVRAMRQDTSLARDLNRTIEMYRDIISVIKNHEAMAGNEDETA